MNPVFPNPVAVKVVDEFTNGIAEGEIFRTSLLSKTAFPLLLLGI